MIGGRYTLDRKIGRGGMGSVWLGRDEVLGRLVAIKRVGMMPDGSSPDLLRAEREARIAASLNHPYIVGVFDLVHDEDEQWLVMEYVEGTTLAEVIRSEGPLPTERIRPMLAMVASALAAAHEAGVVHRDVKPSNILVRGDGEVKLSDFGIARTLTDASLTRTGLVTGSPAYLAPEVASGRGATPASDVWALGATAFHALAGRPPYEVGDNVLGALYQIVNDAPPRLPDAGPLAELIDRCLVSDPTQRWSSRRAADFLGPAPLGRSRNPLAAPGPDPTLVVAPTPDPATTPVPAPIPAPIPVAALARAPAPSPAPSVGPSLDLAPEPTSHASTRPRRGRALPVAVAGLVVTLVVVLVVLLLQNDPQPNLAVEPTPGAASPTASTPTSGTPTTGPTTSAPAQPRIGAMRRFAADYLAAASSTPETAFDLLTPAFQQASGGRSGYLGFWGDLRDVRLAPGSITADAAALTVGYTYTYTKPGVGTRTDDVVLQLSFDAATGTYLVAGDG